MNFIRKLAGAIGLNGIYHVSRNILLKLSGYHLLNSEQTISCLAPYLVKETIGNKISLPEVINCFDGKTVIFPQKEVIADNIYVWDYNYNQKPASLSKYGSVIINKNVLSTDADYNSFYIGLRERGQRSKNKLSGVIGLFSQFQDGVMYGGYYDFVFLVAAKLSRLKDALPPEEFANLPVCYPLFNTTYENEYLQLLGVKSNNLINSVKTKVISKRMITGNSARWYPNLYDVQSLKQNITAKFQPIKTESKRIYVSRKGRRCIVNEAELIEALKKFDFAIIEDMPRSVISQISLFYNASFILGPHGAAFSNIIWCQPGTHLMEIFSSNYMPDFFLYLAALHDMKYSAYYEEAPKRANYLDALVEDIHVSIPQLEKYLHNIFN